nr:MAG TPA: hypothetical protein [Caudoviricetes sp.]
MSKNVSIDTITRFKKCTHILMKILIRVRFLKKVRFS